MATPASPRATPGCAKASTSCSGSGSSTGGGSVREDRPPAVLLMRTPKQMPNANVIASAKSVRKPPSPAWLCWLTSTLHPPMPVAVRCKTIAAGNFRTPRLSLHLSNDAVSRNFVPMSAGLDVPATFAVDTRPLQISSWIQRCRVSMWRNRPTPGRTATCNALALSTCRVTPRSNPISARIACTYLASPVADDMATNSASHDDNAVRG